ncbi:MAG: hypothetical protein HC895_00105 [Leptolyngbyaceae cyanobacterium SM1_3_5]|nr:hypothetical protein [Leptolyngbyaceae cyanobacterium SM1_3_5]
MDAPTSVLVSESLLEIDHFFVCLSASLQPKTLADLGLVCAPQPVHHPRQGTTSNLIFFENIYLELIWIEDESAAEIYAMQSGIDFLARSHWQQTKASPFGIALRQKNEVHQQHQLPDQSETFINFAAENLSAQAEPLCFVISDAISLTRLLDRTSSFHQQLLRHPIGIQQLTEAKIAIDSLKSLSEPVSLLQRENIASIDRGTPLLELTFDRRIQGRTLDLRWLKIPLVLHY